MATDDYPSPEYGTDDDSPEASLSRLERFAELVEAVNARRTVDWPRLASATPPTAELVEKAKLWKGKDSIPELCSLAEWLAVDAEIYNCTEGGRYFSLVSDNWWQCASDGVLAYNKMMVRRSITDLRVKLRAAVRRKASSQAATAGGESAEGGEQIESADSISSSNPPNKQKRSTEKGEGRAKLIAALTKHHKYADGGCLNLEPIGNNDIARLADVADSTASTFFKTEFGGHKKYKNTYCSDAPLLVAAFKKLNDEYTVDALFGGRPPDEDNRDDKD